MNEIIWVTGSLLLLVFCLIPICREDLRERTIPRKWCMVLVGGGVVLALARTLTTILIYRGVGLPITDHSVYTHLLYSVEGALAAVGLGLLCRGIAKEGFGWGDVKLMTALGAAMGLVPFLRGMALTGLLSLCVALFLLLRKKAKASDTVPFAPFLGVGAVASEVLELIWKVE